MKVRLSLCLLHDRELLFLFPFFLFDPIPNSPMEATRLSVWGDQEKEGKGK